MREMRAIVRTPTQCERRMTESFTRVPIRRTQELKAMNTLKVRKVTGSDGLNPDYVR